MSRRTDNYIWVREKQDHELEWIRAEQFNDKTVARPLVIINGGFDLLHVGHMRLIFQARELSEGGTLICAMDSDRRIRESKGPTRPIMSWVERAATLAYMPIDYLVEIDSNVEMRNFLQRLRPNVRVQGGEYITNVSKYPWLQKAYVRSTGIHTSDIVKRITNRYESNLCIDLT